MVPENLETQKAMKMICCDRPRSPNCDLFRLEPEFIRDVLHPKLSLSPNLAKPDRSKFHKMGLKSKIEILIIADGIKRRLPFHISTKVIDHIFGKQQNPKGSRLQFPGFAKARLGPHVLPHRACSSTCIHLAGPLGKEVIAGKSHRCS